MVKSNDLNLLAELIDNKQLKTFVDGIVKEVIKCRKNKTMDHPEALLKIKWCSKHWNRIQNGKHISKNNKRAIVLEYLILVAANKPTVIYEEPPEQKPDLGYCDYDDLNDYTQLDLINMCL